MIRMVRRVEIRVTVCPSCNMSKNCDILMKLCSHVSWCHKNVFILDGRNRITATRPDHHRMLRPTTGKRPRAPPRKRRGEPTELSAEPANIMHQERGRLYALIKLGEEPAEAVIDTGALKSFVSSRVA